MVSTAHFTATVDDALLATISSTSLGELNPFPRPTQLRSPFGEFDIR